MTGYQGPDLAEVERQVEQNRIRWRESDARVADALREHTEVVAEHRRLSSLRAMLVKRAERGALGNVAPFSGPAGRRDF
jgi:hypothetical protein